MSVRAFLFRVLLFIGVLLALIAIGEVWLRSRLFSDDPAYKEWRNPELFTRRYMVDGRVVVRDDRDKLAVQWGLLQPPADHPHRLLGWHGDLDSTTLMPVGSTTEAANAGPVLLGAGWKEHMITTLTGAAPGKTMPIPIDLSVAGFSFDQDLLLFERTRSELRGRKLLLHIDLDDIDQMRRAFIGRPKPWYTIAAYGGELHGVPVVTDIADYLENEPADPGLYLYHLFRTQVLHDTLMSTQAAETEEGELRELFKKLFSSFLAQARADSIEVSVYIEQSSLGALPDRRRWPLQDMCRDAGVTYHVLREEAEALGHHSQVRMMRIFLEHAAYNASQPDYTSLSQLAALREKPEAECTPLERMMLLLLKDEPWSSEVREKAASNGLSFAMMVQRDAQFLLERERP